MFGSLVLDGSVKSSWFMDNLLAIDLSIVKVSSPSSNLVDLL